MGERYPRSVRGERVGGRDAQGETSIGIRVECMSSQPRVRKRISVSNAAGQGRGESERVKGSKRSSFFTAKGSGVSFVLPRKERKGNETAGKSKQPFQRNKANG